MSCVVDTCNVNKRCILVGPKDLVGGERYVLGAYWVVINILLQHFLFSVRGQSSH